jgi:hypothetical protein
MRNDEWWVPSSFFLWQNRSCRIPSGLIQSRLNLHASMKLIYAILFTLSAATAVQAAFPTLYLKPVCTQQLHSPTNITTANDGSGRMFVCDQMGKVFIFQGGMLLPTPFLDLSSTGLGRVIAVNTGYSERGLLGMAFHPGYANSSSPGYRRGLHADGESGHAAGQCERTGGVPGFRREWE